jgi:hypothetical protein
MDEKNDTVRARASLLSLDPQPSPPIHPLAPRPPLSLSHASPNTRTPACTYGPARAPTATARAARARRAHQ